MGSVIKPNKSKLKKEEELRDYQEKTIGILKDMDNNRERTFFSTIINLPTGAGKTKTAEKFLFSVLEQNTKNKVLWLSDRNHLLVQTIESFKRDCPAHCRELSYQLICSHGIGKEKKERITDIDCNTDILFAGIRTLSMAVQNMEDAQDQSIIPFCNWLKESQKDGKLYVIYDEAHHIGSNSAEHLFAWLFAVDREVFYKYQVKSQPCMIENYALIGLTATVYRGDFYLDAFDHWFKAGYDNEEKRICYSEGTLGMEDGDIQNRIELTDIKELIQKGYLIAPEIHEDSTFCREKRPKEEELEDYLVKKIIEEGSTWGKAIVFVKRREFAERVECRLKGVDLGTELFVYVSGVLDKNKQTLQEKKAHQKMIEEFKISGKKKNAIMLTVDMVSEGFDVPDLNTVYLFSPISSRVVLRQRIGRVLRKPDNKKKAQIIWQNFGEKYLTVTVYDDEVKNKRQNKKPYYSRFKFLHLRELFGEEKLVNGGGYIDLGEYGEIPVNQDRKKGYKQFYYQICNDRFTVIKPYEKKQKFEEGRHITFEEYANAFEVSVKALVADIKVVCFAMISDILASKKNLIHENKSKIPVILEEDLEKFFNYVISHDYTMPIIIHCEPENNNRRNMEKGVEKGAGGNTEEQGLDNSAENCEILKNAIKLCYGQYNNKTNPQKVYTEDLIVKDRNDDSNFYFFKEMQSARGLMKIGAIKGGRKSGALFGTEGDLAFIGVNKDGKVQYKELKVKHICKNMVADENQDLIANALITRFNHLYITEDIVDDYAAELKAALEQELKGQEIEIDDRLIYEFMMALGYADNDDLIRMQCKLFGGVNIPKLLQFVIYEKVYDALYNKVSFLKDNRLSPNCQNRGELEEIYQEVVRSYHVSANCIKELYPVEDVIEDYRPYLKTVPYYQGIKTEFLCRLTNWIADYHHSDGEYRFINAFGGSGANNMNFFTRRDTVPKRQVYNDFGVLNATFYTVLTDDEDKQELLKMIQEFHDVIFEKDGGKTPDEFLECFVKEGKNSIRKIKKEIRETEQGIKNAEIMLDEKYIRNYEKEDSCLLAKYFKRSDGELAKDKLSEIEEDFWERLKAVLENFNEVKEQWDIRKLEERLYYINCKIRSLYRLYNIENPEISKEREKRVRIAFIFLMYNTFSDRHFFDDCTIDHYAKFYTNYEAWLDWGSEIFQNVEVKKGDALELMRNEKYNLKNVEWYLDIPYSGTDQSSYSGAIDENDFIDRLSGLKGHYTVSSRINICFNTDNGERKLKIDRKQKSIVYRFYSHFMLKGEDILEDILRKDKTLKGKDESWDKQWSHINQEKKANYILIPFVKYQCIERDKKKQEESSQEQSPDKQKQSRKQKPYKIEKNSTPFNRRSIIRMISSVIYGNIPIEVMITDKDIKLDSPIHLVDGIGVLPTFRTMSNYLDEPAVIIMEYEEFFEILQQVLYQEEYPKECMEGIARDNARLFRESEFVNS